MSINRVSNIIMTIYNNNNSKEEIKLSIDNVYIALLLSSKGYKIGIIDYVVNKNIIRKKLKIRNVIKYSKDKIIPYTKYGVNILLTSLFLAEKRANEKKDLMLLKIINKMMMYTKWKSLDFLIINSVNSKNIINEYIVKYYKIKVMLLYGYKKMSILESINYVKKIKSRILYLLIYKKRGDVLFRKTKIDIKTRNIFKNIVNKIIKYYI